MKKHWAYLVIGLAVFLIVGLMWLFADADTKAPAEKALPQSVYNQQAVGMMYGEDGGSASGSLPNGKNKNADVER